MLPERFKQVFRNKKTQEELDEHYNNLELEKGDYPAMVIAALLTFLPVLLIAMGIIYGIAWLFFLRS